MAKRLSSFDEISNNNMMKSLNASLLENQTGNIVDSIDRMLIDFDPSHIKEDVVDKSDIIASSLASCEEVCTASLSVINRRLSLADLFQENICSREVLDGVILNCVDDARFDPDSDRMEIAYHGIENISQIVLSDDFLEFPAGTAESTGSSQVSCSNIVDLLHSHFMTTELPQKSATTGIIESPSILKDRECLSYAPSADTNADITESSGYSQLLGDDNINSDVASTSALIDPIDGEFKNHEFKIDHELPDSITELLHLVRCRDLSVLRDTKEINDAGPKELEVDACKVIDTLEVLVNNDEVIPSCDDHSNHQKVSKVRNNLRSQTDDTTRGFASDSRSIGLEIDIGEDRTTIIDCVTLNKLMLHKNDSPDAIHAPRGIIHAKEVEAIQKQKAADANLEHTTSATAVNTEHVNDSPQRCSADGNKDTCLYSVGASQLKVDTFAKRLNYLNSVDKLNSPKKICPRGEAAELLPEVSSGFTTTEVAIMKEGVVVTENTITEEIPHIKESIVVKECATVDPKKVTYQQPATNKTEKLQSTIFATAANKITSDDHNQYENWDGENASFAGKISCDISKDKISLFARLFGRKDQISMVSNDEEKLPIFCGGILMAGTCYNAFAQDADMMENNKYVTVPTTADGTTEDGEDRFVET